jgi:protein O-mannosyl-transferase
MTTSTAAQTANFQSDSFPHKKYLGYYLFFFLLAFLFYGNSIKNGFSMDDELVTTTDRQEHPIVSQGWQGVGKVFTSRYAQDGKQSYAYRPITSLTFVVEYALFKNSPNRAQISHIISISLYGFCGILLFIYLLTLFKGSAVWFSFIVVSLFMIHPIHSEVVNNIKTRDELLVFLFGLTSMIAALRFFDSRKKKFFVLATLSFFLAIFSKESGAMFVALIPLSLYFFRDFSLKNALVLSVGAIFLFFVLKKGGAMLLDKQTVRYFQFFENPLYTMDFSARIPMFFYTIVLYLIFLFKPFPLSFYYGYNEIPIVDFGDIRFYFALVLVLLMVAVIAKGVKSKSPLSFGFAFFLISIAGASNLLIVAPGIFAERFAYMASIGFAYLVVLALFKWRKYNPEDMPGNGFKKNVYIGFVILALPAMLYAWQRNPAWNSAFDLYKTDIVHLPNSMKAHSLLGTEYSNKAFALQQSGNVDEFLNAQAYADSALSHYERAIEIYPGYANSYNNVSVLHYNFKADIWKSLSYTRKAIELDSLYTEAIFNLAGTYGKLKTFYQEIESSAVVGGNPGAISRAQFEVFQAKLREGEYLKAWEKLNILSQTYQSFWSRPINLSIIQSYLRFAENMVNSEGNWLVKMNLSAQLSAISGLAQDQQSKRISAVFAAARKKLLEQMSLLTPEGIDVVDYLKAGQRFYYDSVFVTFDKLYEIDPLFARQYAVASSLAGMDNDYIRLIDWARRMLIHYPDLGGQAYAQIGFAYKELGYRDSAVYYFSESIVLKENELKMIKSQPSNPDRNNASTNLRVEIDRIRQVVSELNSPLFYENKSEREPGFEYEDIKRNTRN